MKKGRGVGFCHFRMFWEGFIEKVAFEQQLVVDENIRNRDLRIDCEHYTPIRMAKIQHGDNTRMWSDRKRLHARMLSRVPLFVNPWPGVRQAALSMEFSRQEYCSGLPLPSPGNLSNPGIEPESPALQADSLPSELPGKPSSVLEVPKASVPSASTSPLLRPAPPLPLHECRQNIFAGTNCPRAFLSAGTKEKPCPGSDVIRLGHERKTR